MKRAFFIGCTSLFLWIILSFGPPNAPTIAYAGSYATFLLLYFTLGAYLSRHGFIRYISIISALYMLIINAILLSKPGSEVNSGYIFLASFFFVAGLVFLNHAQDLIGSSLS